MVRSPLQSSDQPAACGARGGAPGLALSVRVANVSQQELATACCPELATACCPQGVGNQQAWTADQGLDAAP